MLQADSERTSFHAYTPAPHADFAQESGCIRSKKQFQEISTQKNGVYFTTNALQTMRREFDQLSDGYNRTQSGLVSEVVNVAGEMIPWCVDLHV